MEATGQLVGSVVTSIFTGVLDRELVIRLVHQALFLQNRLAGPALTKNCGIKGINLEHPACNTIPSSLLFYLDGEWFCGFSMEKIIIWGFKSVTDCLE